MGGEPASGALRLAGEQDCLHPFHERRAVLGPSNGHMEAERYAVLWVMQVDHASRRLPTKPTKLEGILSIDRAFATGRRAKGGDDERRQISHESVACLPRR